jgi:hypothetical protein
MENQNNGELDKLITHKSILIYMKTQRIGLAASRIAINGNFILRRAKLSTIN